MTLSIIARCAQTGQFGISATTALPAVGKLLDHAHTGLGAVATQGKLNPYLGIDGIRLLEQGRTAREVVDELSRADDMAARRQFAVIDSRGETAVWTGDCCKDYAGSIEGDGFSVQGNRLTDRGVIEAAARSYEAHRGAPLVERLLNSLAAGVDAGGDRLGEQSASILVVADQEYPLWDIRVDQHDRPIVELVRLKQVFQEELYPHILLMPTRENPAGQPGEYDV